MILFGIPVFIRVFVIVPFPMSMFCKFRHRGKSNVFIVIRSVGIRSHARMDGYSIGVLVLVSLCAGFECYWKCDFA